MSAVDQTYDFSDGGNTGFPAVAGGRFYVLEKVVDVEELITDGTGSLASATQVTAAEMIGVIKIPKYTWVLNVFVRTITASTDTTATIDIGDGVDEQGYLAGFDITAAGTDMGVADSYAVGAATSGRWYTSADTIDVQFNNDTTNGKFLVQAVCVNLRHGTDS